MSDTPDPRPTPTPLPTDEEMAASLAATERRNRIRWTAIFLGMVSFGVAAFILSATYREELFRPRPDMEAVERSAAHWSNDPACRELIANVDSQQQRWKAERLRLKELFASADPKVVEAGRVEVRAMIDAYEIERRRLDISIFQNRDTQTANGKWVRTDVHADVRQYFKHILFYLNRAEKLLAQRHEALTPKPEPEPAADPDNVQVPGLGVVAVIPVKPPAAKPATPEDWERAWSMITEDHEKWRIFRQGPIPCGHREGEAPPLPAPPSGDPLQDLRDSYSTPSASASTPSASASAPSASAPSASAPSAPASAPSP